MVSLEPQDLTASLVCPARWIGPMRTQPLQVPARPPSAAGERRWVHCETPHRIAQLHRHVLIGPACARGDNALATWAQSSPPLWRQTGLRAPLVAQSIASGYNHIATITIWL